MLSLHLALVALWAPIVARSPRVAGRLLRGFARAELGSVYTLRWAAVATPSVERRASYLRHADDEARHARLFDTRAAALDGRHEPLRADAEDLFEQLGEARFLAFLERAEGRGRREFAHYARAFERAGDTDTARIFRAIMVDEERHETYAAALLDLTPDAAPARRHALRWDVWRGARRMGTRLADAVYALCMALTYPLLAPGAWWARRRAFPPER